MLIDTLSLFIKVACYEFQKILLIVSHRLNFTTILFVQNEPETDVVSVQEVARADHFRFAAVAPDARECATIGT